MENEEEKKLTPPVEEIDDDFADATPFVSEAEKEPEPEPEPEPQPAVEETPEPEEEPVPEQEYSSDYDDPRFESIEAARSIWNKSYKKMARIKFIVSIVVLLGILAGWLIPTLLMKNNGMVPLYIGLGAAVAGIAIILIFGYFQRRHDKEDIRVYFNTYFDAVNSYTLGDLGITNITGTVDDKVTKDEFLAPGIFESVASVGSRDNVVFTYKGMECALAESAAQKDAGKALQTIFVGKYLRTHNNVEVGEDGLVLYFSGNDRALPPAKLESLHIVEKNSRYTVYGSAADKKVLTKKFREALGKIRTNKLLVDITLVIKSGRTYWYLGYEDDIMVLPNDKMFDPRFIKQYKGEIELILNAALLLNE